MQDEEKAFYEGLLKDKDDLIEQLRRELKELDERFG